MNLKNENLEKNKIYLLGLCGMGVGPLSIYIAESGWKVFGWDDAPNPAMVGFLEKANITFTQELDPGVTLVARSSAVKPGHFLYDLAVEKGLRLIRRGELLAECVADKKFIAVCGSHGKTTTTGMLSQAIRSAGVDAGYILGGLFRNTEISPAHYSKNSDWVVAEVDESDGTIKCFSPEITVAVNLDWDHSDYYRDEAALEETFRNLFLRTKRAVFIPYGNERLIRISKNLNIPVYTVGPEGDFSYRVLNVGKHSIFVELSGKFPNTSIEIPIVGRFNTINAMLALAATSYVSDGKIGFKSLGEWNGICRRQDLLFSNSKVNIFADYAHHPTEISALLTLLREQHFGRLIVVFQPHRYSRTKQYADAFSKALAMADEVLLLPVYSAGEACVEGGNSEAILSRAIENNKKITLFKSADEALVSLRNIYTGELPDDSVIAFVGAGDIDRIAAAVFVRELWNFLHIEQEITKKTFLDIVSAQLPECLIEKNKNIGLLTTLKIGGRAKYYAEPNDFIELSKLLKLAANEGLQIFIMGRGSNLLVPDDGFDGLIIRLTNKNWTSISKVLIESSVKSIEEKTSDAIRVGSGTILRKLCLFAAENGLSGFEFLEGIPGTIGGALRMNAGAMGASIFDCVHSVEWLMPDGSHCEVLAENLHPIYRDCPELHGAIILSAILKPKTIKSSEEILKTMAMYAELRRDKQPIGHSAGCTFKNPLNGNAGKWIEEAHLKGSSIGGISVSSVHGNFLIAEDKAKTEDFVQLVKKIVSIIKIEKGVTLSPEIILLGKEWSDILH